MAGRRVAETTSVQREGSSRSWWADLCPMVGLGGSGPVDRWNRWLLAWHAFVYASLAVATVTSLADSPSTAQARLAGGLSLLLAAWYGYWMVLRQDLIVSGVVARAVYFTLAGVAWAALLATDRHYQILTIAAYGQLLSYLNGRSALVGAGAATLLLAGSEGLTGGLGTPGGLRWVGIGVDDLIDPLLALTAVTLVFLWSRAAVRQSAERQRLNDDLRATREELAVAERQTGMLHERQRLAAEIHDTLTQELASIVMLLEAAQTCLGTRPASASDRVGQALGAARDSLREVRRLVWSLRPEALEQGTLEQALERVASLLSHQSGVATRTVVTGTARALPTEVEVTILRAAQEALANIRRHARAGEATLTLSYMDDVVVLDVRDDGVGFDMTRIPAPPGEQGGLGLVGMRERAETLQGSLNVESIPGEGTTLVVAIPIQPDVSPAAQPSDAAAR